MENKTRWLDRPIHPALPAVTNEVAVFVLILVVALVTRFYDLETRVMSHDESLHTYFSYLLYKGQGYQHTPMMHGPFQFHFLAVVYYLFGVSDFTARIPAVLLSIATVWMVWYWRKYLGRAGALIAGFLLVISPYMLYYGRYVRNEAFAGFSGILMLYVILRYLETGGKKYLYLLTLALLLHFTAKETSFIYAAQAMLYLGVYFIARVTRKPWEDQSRYNGFIIAMVIGFLLIIGAVAVTIIGSDLGAPSATETAVPADPIGGASPFAPLSGGVSIPTILVVLAVLTFIAAAVLLIIGYSWQAVRTERSFDLLIVTGTLVLPSLVAFVIKAIEPIFHVAIPTDNASVSALTSGDVVVVGSLVAAMFIISIMIGLIWNREIWWKVALLYWVPFIVLFTTVFTNSAGFFTGVVGSLGYWLVQQGVERGSQPWYFYILVQIPIYEFLPALGSILAIFLGFSYRARLRREASEALEAQLLSIAADGEPVPAEEPTSESAPAPSVAPEALNFNNTFSLLVWWCVSSVAAFSYAGEKMPWLTYHMAWPMILLTGWGLGYLVERFDWDAFARRKTWIILALTFLFASSLTTSLRALLGTNPPFQGKDLASLQATGDFLLPALAVVFSGAGLFYLLQDWTRKQFFRLALITVFALLAVFTARASFRASYINYDNATEYLVYAHGATGIKDVIAQAAEISERTTGGMGVALAYDASAPDTGVSWPFVWYLRDFTNQRSFDVPSRSLRDSVVVIVDQKNFDKIESALGPGYYRFDYIRMWWPNQDYFGLTYPRDASIPFPESYACRGVLGFLRLVKNRDYSRVCNAILDPAIREGIMDIWWDRDYTQYAFATGSNNMTLPTWQPADQMRLYIRKDVAAQIWNYGVGPRETIADVDPYAAATIVLPADQIIDSSTLAGTTMNAPRGMAFAPDGTFYVTDSRNHRVLHLDTDGAILHVWGSFGDGVNAPSPIGTFNEPWGIAVGPDGSVYVSDTWNHRVQKFSAEGEPITTWGHYGQGDTPDAFWGPRGLAVDREGNVYVADTGNKRIVIFDADGNYLNQFGAAGMDAGQFDEPVGVAVAPNGVIYVTDTWNRRVQAFASAVEGQLYVPALQWDIDGWVGQSLENKPFIAVNAEGHVFITDPEGYRVIEFDAEGKFIRTWGNYGLGPAEFGLASGIAIDSEGHIWVTDAVNQRIMRFTLP
jgi:predicted membrane-bound mannosyltransferase/DNA-binding beta-propeller fold protein YncE